MYTEDYRHNGFFIRKLLLKVILIIAILALLIWIVPKFMSYKPSNKTKNATDAIKITERNTKKTDLKENLQALKDASLIHYKEDKLPKEKGDIEIVTLEQLIDEKLITELSIDKEKCDKKKSYAKITKLEDDYLLKVSIVCGSKTDYLLIHVGKYDYCTNTICEKDESKKPNEKEENKDKKVEEERTKREERIAINPKEKEETKPDDISTISSATNNKVEKSAHLTSFGAWSNYTKTSCDTPTISCDINDKNCLKEVRVKKEAELVREEAKSYSTVSLGLIHKSSRMVTACKSYNYISIQGITYRTTGNYDQISYLGNRSSTDSWQYIETISTKTTPNFGGNKYYKFIGVDWSSCGSTCPDGPSYFYEVYQYMRPLIRVNNFLDGCSGVAGTSGVDNKVIKNYTIAKFPHTVSRMEQVYQDVCYESVRTRELVK